MTALIFFLVFLLIYLVANYTVVRNIDRELQLEIDKHKGEIFLVNGKIRFLHMDEWEEMEHAQLQLNPICIEIVDLEGNSMDRSRKLRENQLTFSHEQSLEEEALTHTISSREVRQRQNALLNE